MGRTCARHRLKVNSMNHLCIVFSLCFSLGMIVPNEAEAGQPNVLVIMADDLGFSDLGCYGSRIQTPNLDALAHDGLRFTQFYNASRCCPTRASLLTGMYPHEVGLIQNGTSLSQEVPTIAELLREAGYHTAMAGKWHLTKSTVLRGNDYNGPEHMAVLNNQTRVDWFGERETYPAARGFDKHYGVIWGIVNFYHPFALVDGFTPVYDLPKDYYLTDALNEKTADYIRSFAKDDKPFFIYLAHAAPHWPLHAPAETRAKYTGVFDAGWEAQRAFRYQRQLELGLFDPDSHPLPELDLGRRGRWTNLNPEQQARDIAKMEVHAAMVDRLDHGLTGVLDALKETGQFDNTIILFLSDNGASPEEPGRPGYDRSGETPDGRTIRYTDKFPPEEMGRDDTYTGLGPALANACNTPFRFWKKESYHGGNASPFIVHWPAGLKAKPNAISTEITHVNDIVPTVLEAAGLEYPATFEDKKLKNLRGKSLLPVLKGGERDGHEKLFFEHVGGAAHRNADWKIVRMKGKPWELYDLSVDRTETTNLAGKHPARVDAMDADWRAWWKDVTGQEFKPAASSKKNRAAISNRDLVISATVQVAEKANGVVICQGGNQHGFSLHFIAGVPAFDQQVRSKGTRLTAKQKVAGKVSLKAQLTAANLVLFVDGKEVARGPSLGHIPVEPQDGRCVGHDADTAAGDYVAPNTFSGKVLSTQVQTKK